MCVVERLEPFRRPNHSSMIGHRSSSRVGCLPLADWSVAFYRAQCWVPCFSYSTPPRFQPDRRERSESALICGWHSVLHQHCSNRCTSCCSAFHQLLRIVERLDGEELRNCLKMNAEKTQVIWIGCGSSLQRSTSARYSWCPLSVAFSETVSNIGVLTDCLLSVADHVATLCCSEFFQLYQLLEVHSLVRPTVFAFVSSRLDYCNSLLSGIGDGLPSRLQSVQNAAAWLLTGSRKCDHITPVLRRLSWLRVHHRVSYKIALLVYRCVHGMAPPYLADDCIPLSSIAG